MSDTPKTDAIYEQFGPSFAPSEMAYFSLCRELEREAAELRAWKESAMQVEREWDAQELAKLTECPLGVSIRGHLMKAIPELVEQAARYRHLCN